MNILKGRLNLCMNSAFAQKAIKAALRGNWLEAEQYNLEILKQSPKDIDALNRLAHALGELGKRAQARKTCKKVLRIDPYNKIAQRALERLGKAKQKGKQSKKAHPVETSFIEEPGKTKTVTLIHLGAEAVITSLDTGEPVRLVPHAHRVTVQTEEGKYIARLPDDLSRRLIKLIRAGNEYKALVRSLNDNQVKIFIKETKRAPGLSDTPSFPQGEKAENYISFTSPDLVYDEKPEVSSLEEEGEE